jgi:hypothetical protein
VLASGASVIANRHREDSIAWLFGRRKTFLSARRRFIFLRLPFALC